MTKTFLQMILLTALFCCGILSEKNRLRLQLLRIRPPDRRPPLLNRRLFRASRPRQSRPLLKREDNLKPIDLILPKPQFVGTPEKYCGRQESRKALGAPGLRFWRRKGLSWSPEANPEGV